MPELTTFKEYKEIAKTKGFKAYSYTNNTTKIKHI